MRYAIQHIFLTDNEGKPLSERKLPSHHLVEAVEVDGAISALVATQNAAFMGPIQHFSSSRAQAIALRDRTVFVLDAVAGSDA